MRERFCCLDKSRCICLEKVKKHLEQTPLVFGFIFVIIITSKTPHSFTPTSYYKMSNNNNNEKEREKAKQKNIAVIENAIAARNKVLMLLLLLLLLLLCSFLFFYQ
jgi:hypothetical protein